MIINVTQSDIDNGIRNSTCSCPIALAAKRAINDGALPSVCCSDIEFEYKTERDGDVVYRFKSAYLPTIARDFIRKFDNGGTVEPFSFEITYDIED